MDINFKFELMLRSVAMNLIEPADQKFALDILSSMARGDVKIDLSPMNKCFELNITKKTWEEIQAQILYGNKIPAIRTLRLATGLGLIEAKNAIENTKYFKQKD